MLIDHSEKGSSGLLLERRTGALMADISMEDFGCVAISPLWLGGVAKQARPASPSSRDDKNTLSSGDGRGLVSLCPMLGAV